ncbi:hypothetical protein MGMO_157c00010 [Methyloglobulus morosus KoM1]|uniref:Uncharacterized protein n=1 Tax=Methyloglobulus morosus KoM1 TaxID=1116472 RepID=V5BTD1_9GAMM|nr:hypothetical protein MGMO_157c00010 [Methyloglobulus morosus KoM1]
MVEPYTAIYVTGMNNLNIFTNRAQICLVYKFVNANRLSVIAIP